MDWKGNRWSNICVSFLLLYIDYNLALTVPSLLNHNWLDLLHIYMPVVMWRFIHIYKWITDRIPVITGQSWTYRKSTRIWHFQNWFLRKISLLHAPDHSILTSNNWKISLPCEGGGGHTLPDPPPLARSLRSLAFVTFPLGVPPPPMRWPTVRHRLSIFLARSCFRKTLTS